MRGFRELRERARGRGNVSVVAVQPEGCSNIVRAFAQGRTEPEPGDSTSRISGLQVPNPPDGKLVLEGLLAGEGWAEAVPDECAWKWQEKLAAEEGILCEPAASITLAGLERSVRNGRIPDDAIVVCVITGAGYKDGDRLKEMFDRRPPVLLRDIDELERESGTDSEKFYKF
jgi:threonine synthase